MSNYSPPPHLPPEQPEPLLPPSSPSSQSQALLKSSIELLKTHKKLLLFPICATLFYYIIVAILLYLFYEYRTDTQPLYPIMHKSLWYLYAPLLILMFFTHWVSLFFNAAFTQMVHSIFKHQSPEHHLGWKTAVRRFWAIYCWTLFISTFGLIFQLFQSLFRMINPVRRHMRDLPWVLAAYFVFPIVVTENVSIWAAFRKSIDLIVDTWGSPIVPNFGFNLRFILLRLLALSPFFITFLIGNNMLLLGGLVVSGMMQFCLSLANITLRTITLNALYYYALEHRSPPYFESIDLQQTFIPAPPEEED